MKQPASSATPLEARRDGIGGLAAAESSQAQKNPAGCSNQPAGQLWEAVGYLVGSQLQGPPIAPIERTGSLPLSHAQERLWLLCEAEPDTKHYNIPLAWRVTGTLDVDALRQSLNAVFARHDSLRASFPALDGRPVTVISQSVEFRLRIVDLQPLPEAQREKESMQGAVAEVQGEFDLSQGPLCRAALFHLDSEHHLLVLVIHQIVCDGMSLRIISRDLGAFYRALADGKQPAMTQLAIQYLDFANWQNNLLQDEFLDTERSYWSEKLSKPYAPLRLPLDHPRLETGTSPAGVRAWGLSKQLTDEVTGLGRQVGTTQFVVLLAALQTLLHGYTGQEDIIVFCSLAARNRPELKPLVGLLANVVPFRADFTGVRTFRGVLERVSEVVSKGFAHQVLPFEMILELLPSVRDARRTPVCQVMMIHQNAPLPAMVCGSVTFQPWADIDNGAAKFDLLLDVSATDQGLKGILKYRADIFEAPTIDRMLGYLEGLLRMVVADPDTPLEQLFSRSAGAEEVAAAGGEEQPQTIFIAPRDELERQLVQLWEKLLRVQPVGVRDDFFALGGTSLLAARLFTKIGKSLGQNLQLAALIEAPTIEQLAGMLRRKQTQKSTLVPLRPGGRKPPLFCLPGAAGHVLALRDLSLQVDAEQPFFSIEAKELAEEAEQGASSQRTGFSIRTRVEDIAADYIEAMRTVQPKGPYFLAGLCFGGVVAFEMAHQLGARGESVPFLALLDPPVPGLRSHSLKARAIDYYIDRLRLLNFSGKLRYVLRVTKNLAVSVLEKIENALHGIILKVAMRAGIGLSLLDHRAVAIQAAISYMPRPYSGPFILYLAHDNGVSRNASVEKEWRDLARGEIKVETVPGDHGNFFREPHMQAWAEQFRAYLSEAQGESEASAPAQTTNCFTAGAL